MSAAWVKNCQSIAAGLSVALTLAIGAQLLLRLVRVVRGKECESGMRRRGAIDWRGMLLAAGAALATRVLVYGVAYAMMRLSGVEGGFFDSLSRLWMHWDTRHYIGIAQEGYTAVGDERLRLVFFPLFPLLMRVFSLLTGGNLFAGGLLVSLVCSCASAALCYDLCAMHGGRRTGALGVAYFLLSPMSVFLNCAYTEALFIALTLGTVCLLRRDHPWLAALLGAASALTRMPGVIVAGLFIIRLIGQIPKKTLTGRSALACLGQVLIVFSGLAIYWGINWIVTGDPLMYLTYQKENWFQEAGTIWNTASTTTYYALTTIGADDWFFCWVTQLMAIFAMLALLALRQRRLPFDLAAYSFVYVAVVLSPTWLLSGPRYLYALCALPLLKAKMVKGSAAHGVLLGISAALLLLYTFGYTLAIAVL